eukprot:GHUV01018651.1.p1 GENE.GHUV01018651.1~~GHUV01018651.1.p1  ORF type:complete len:235 (+),score=86.36 GHUV01018651.1:81-785(+)
MGLLSRASLVLLVLCCSHPGLGKVFEVNWAIPEDGLILPSVSTAKCGDVVRFKCPPGVAHGVYKMTSVNGTCPDSFAIPSAGDVLSAPMTGCDFSITLDHGPDFFVTSQYGLDCHKNLKMNIHSVCPQTTGTSATMALGMNNVNSLSSSAGSWSTGVVPGSRFPQTGAIQSPLAAAQNAYSSSMMLPGQQQQQQQPGVEEAGGTHKSAANSVGASGSWLGLAAAALAAGAAMLV